MVWEPLDVPEDGNGHFTDLSRWRLNAWDNGRHAWDFLDSDEACEARPQTILDKLMLGVPVVCDCCVHSAQNLTRAEYRTCRNFLQQKRLLKQPGMDTSF